MKTKPVVILLLSALACAALRAAPICDFMGCKFGSQSPSVAGITNALGSAYGEWSIKTAGMPPFVKDEWWSARKIANTGEVFTVSILTTRKDRLFGVWLEWEYPTHDDATRNLIESDAAGIVSDLSAQYGVELSKFNVQDGTTIVKHYFYDGTNDVSVCGAIDSTCGSDRWFLWLHVIRRDIEAADRL